MKKGLAFISTITLILLLSIFMPFKNVDAEEMPLSLEDVSLSDKSYSVGIENLGTNNNEVENTMFFNKVGDFIDYEVTIKNNSDKEITIEEIVDDNTSEYITYEYPDSEGKVVAAGENNSFHIKAVYAKAASTNNLTNDPVNFGIRYRNNETSNALTVDAIVLYIGLFFISALVFMYLLIREKKYSKYALLLMLSLGVFIPFKATAASFKLEIKLNNEITVKTVSYIKTGPEVCVQIHKLAANNNVALEDFTHYESTFKKVGNYNRATNVTNFSQATEEQYNEVKNSLNDDNLISTDDSEEPVYIWFNTNTIYYYSPADTIFLNPDSSYLFSWLTKLETIDFSGLNTSNVTSMEALFFQLNTITDIDLTKLYTGSVTNMRGMFAECNKIDNVDVAILDTRKVTDMSYMFLQCSELSNINTVGFNTSNVTNMSYMFARCTGHHYFKLSNINTSKVKNMYRMFYDNLGDGTIELSNLDLSSVTDMSYMFFCSESKEHIIFDNVKTRDLVNMRGMFFECYGLSEIDLSSFDTSNVTDMSRLFAEDYDLKKIDISNFNTKNVTNMNSMFNGCERLETVVLNGLNTENVTDMGSMFSDCRVLKSLDLSSFNTSLVTKYSYMFYDCRELETIYVSDSFSIENTNELNDMFLDCNSLVGGAGTAYDSNHTGMEYARIDEGPSNPGYFTRKDN